MESNLEKNDIVVAEKPYMTKQFSSATDYPFNLDADKVTRLIYFFGARRCSIKANTPKGKKNGAVSHTPEFTSMERRFIEDALPWFGVVHYNPTQFNAGYRNMVSKFKQILVFLKERPAFISPEIHRALETAGYKSVLKNIVLVMNENRELCVRVVDMKGSAKPIPIAKLEQEMWEFQNTLSDKMKLIVESITLADIRKANLGIKAKAVRDLYATMHMARLANKAPNPTLIGINIQTSSVGEKLKAVTAYAIKNREKK